MSDDGFWVLILSVAIGLMFLAVGHSCGADTTNEAWRNRLVDQPEYVEAVKAEVLAERAREELESSE